MKAIALTSSDIIAIKKHLDNIKRILGDKIEMMELGGSMSKGTELRGLSDVDALFFINKFYTDSSPKYIKTMMKRILEKSLPNTEIVIGNLSVTVKFSDVEVQLLPAVKLKEGSIRIVSENGKSWSSEIDYKAFEKKLDGVCKQYGKSKNGDDKVRCIIKLMKYSENKAPEDSKLTNYHIENIVVKALDGYCNKHVKESDLLVRCYDYASKRVLKKMDEITGQSAIIDEYLGPSNDVLRHEISERMTSNKKIVSSRNPDFRILMDVKKQR